MSEKEIKICEHCKQEYFLSPECTVEKKNQEHLNNFGFEADVEETAIICDDCYREFMEWFGNLSPEEKADLEKERMSWS